MIYAKTKAIFPEKKNIFWNSKQGLVNKTQFEKKSSYVNAFKSNKTSNENTNQTFNSNQNTEY